MTTDDLSFLQSALAQGLGQMGKTWPNPSVGCVIVKGARVIAEGATGDGGRPHAEEIALDKAGSAAAGATAYVTLEPCGERSNGGCSCSQRLVDAGVARVVYACDDPSPLASHKGPQRMKTAGIEVENGLMADQAEILIRGFVHFLRTGLPLAMEVESGEGYDAEFVRDPALTPEDDLRAWGSKGYRQLYVRPGSKAAMDLRLAGLLAAASGDTAKS